MTIYFILVEPSHPDNIGAAARAIKTMGFEKLRLVKPCNHLSDPAKWLAHASIDILEQAEVFQDFDDAIKDVDLIIGTTAKARRARHDYYTSEQLIKTIESKGSSVSKVAVVFGREDKGLINKELKRCDLVSNILIRQRYPSLNLAQAVMIYAYCLSPLTIKKIKPTDANKKPVDFGYFKERIAQSLRKLEIDETKLLYHRVLERISALNAEDIQIIHAVCNWLDSKIKNLK